MKISNSVQMKKKGRNSARDALKVNASICSSVLTRVMWQEALSIDLQFFPKEVETHSFLILLKRVEEKLESSLMMIKTHMHYTGCPGKFWIASHCLKITQNVAFEFFNFGIFHQFLSY